MIDNFHVREASSHASCDKYVDVHGVMGLSVLGEMRMELGVPSRQASVESRYPDPD